MALTAAQIAASLGWTLSKANTGGQPTRQGPEALSFGPTIDLTLVTQVLKLPTSFTSGEVKEVDVSTFTNFVTEAVTPTKAFGIILIPTGTSVSIATGTTNGLVWLAETVPDGGVLLYFQPLAKVIDATHKTIKLTAGAAALTLAGAVLLG
jgi:hypothetical protein